MNRRKAREKAIQALFQMDVGKHDIEDALENVSEGTTIDPFLRELVESTLQHQEEIDALIKKHLIKWPFERLGNIDKAVMRLAVGEMKFIEDIPTNVTLNEAIEMAKTFGDDETRKFTNGVLSKIANQELD